MCLTAGLSHEWDIPLYGELLEIGGGKERMTKYFLVTLHNHLDIPAADILGSLCRHPSRVSIVNHLIGFVQDHEDEEPFKSIKVTPVLILKGSTHLVKVHALWCVQSYMFTEAAILPRG
jgi:hypothetical protein